MGCADFYVFGDANNINDEDVAVDETVISQAESWSAVPSYPATALPRP